MDTPHKTPARRPRLWTALAASLVLATGAGAPATAAAAAPAYCGPDHIGPGYDSNESMAKETLRRLNQVRRGHGLPKLRPDDRLRAAATAHARDMIRRRYFAHDGPGGPAWPQDFRSSGYLVGDRTWSIGQNIAWGRYQCGAPRGIVHMWMHSPPHRRVILTRRFRDVGIAVVSGAPVPAEGPAATYVADFGIRR
jgi:uncharacterized protein YkwD